jgi:valyl-tRNA synthetase
MTALPKKYDFHSSEERLRAWWEEQGVYHFAPDLDQPIYSIDTPPPTVSGHLHMGHVYSYTHADVLARFRRMRGYAVFYPMGYDDNGLPTERLVEREAGCRAAQMARGDFIARCLEVSELAETEYRDLWQRLGLSVDWRHTYRTIGDRAVRLAQRSFIDLYKKELVYRREAPVLWCPHCGTAIAQAELEDIERQGVLYELAFELEDEGVLPIATTRPELLAACVAVFVHPQDSRFRDLVGKKARLPLFDRQVPIIADEGADPQKGTGAVMSCTFGDSADVEWWRLHQLPLIQALDRQGCLSQAAGKYAGLAVGEGRQSVIRDLEVEGRLLGRQDLLQSVRVHERCDSPIEYLVTPQWFVRVLEYKQELLDAGDKITWYPLHMKVKYRQWVENLNWDWCISRQRYFGVSFPVWYCASCGAVRLAEKEQLPLQWGTAASPSFCECGANLRLRWRSRFSSGKSWLITIWKWQKSACTIRAVQLERGRNTRYSTPY